MDSTNNAQINAKTFLRILTMISAIALVFSITFSSAYAVPNLSNDPSADCNSTGKKSPNGLELVRCCWYVAVEPGKGYEGTGDEYYCSECENGGSRGNINCSEPELQFRTAPTTDDSILPNDDSKVLDEQQPSPNSPLPDQRIPPGNAGVLEQLGDSSNNQNSESEDSVSSDNSGLFNVVPQNSQP